MKDQLRSLLEKAVERLQRQGVLPSDVRAVVKVDRARDAAHGDFATNVALVLAKAAGKPPRQLAEAIVVALPREAWIRRVEIAGPGFINFFIDPAAQFAIVGRILEQGGRFGHSDIGRGRRIHIEFVSANPTGPLHVGHGRGAAYGASVANLLAATGFRVHREYYVNDAGRQMDILTVSIWMRYLEVCGEAVPFPANGYRGDYVRDIAQALHARVGDRYRRPAAEVLAGLPPDAPEGDKETYIDALIVRARQLLGEAAYEDVFQTGLQAILADIREDLEAFGVHYDQWFSERDLVRAGRVEQALETLRRGGWLYEKDGAVWFASSRLGDEKDRVVVRDNGQYTYFASDIAYHLDKLEREFEHLIDVWGADHHGYVPRLKAAIQALGADPDVLEVRLVQFAVLYRGKEKVPMSTRAGEFVTLRQLREEVGKDAARFFYVMRKPEQHLDFDLELAVSQSNDNPVYYVQYAHARVCSVFRQLREKGWEWDREAGLENLPRLTESHEQALLATLGRYPEVVERAALLREPHQLTHYLRELAAEFHTYYNAHTFLVEDAALRNARLCLIAAVRQTIANGLGLLDVSAPESM
ncbi:arginyl-tRNA synthetase [Methylomarinovum tepidoasis]|uniref:Arginine--tRNA ligase n=1 Tax=Methylomarinovum tepidoasis TaxID=2840183 RepID=A0AAU9C3U7_9GAMM|nr:arginine--tRNA ligase [Methylomarinovum sp. IN45]BCX88107.1 arginyl-tRNA synthetase [Methylomarinovum sp. IN45]